MVLSELIVLLIKMVFEVKMQTETHFTRLNTRVTFVAYVAMPVVIASPGLMKLMSCCLNGTIIEA